MASRFSNQVALVTGGTGGLGRAVTLALLHESASVIATYIKKDEADALRDAVGTHAHLELLPLDATDESACRALVDGITARHGHLDILVNAIGGYAGGKTVWETDPKTYQLMLTLNLHAGFNLARTVVPAMLKQKSGSIVNIASKAAVDHAAGAGAYAASKAAALALFEPPGCPAITQLPGGLGADLLGDLAGVHVGRSSVRDDRRVSHVHDIDAASPAAQQQGRSVERPAGGRRSVIPDHQVQEGFGRRGSGHSDPG